MEKAVLKFYRNILKLKKLVRTGWLERGVSEPENVAAHSFAVALLVAVLADLKGVNVLDAVRMALIHDLPEAVTGDLTPEMKKKFEKLEEVELGVFEDLAKELPEDVGSKYLEAWRRYSRGEDPVARLVKDVDKLEMGLQALAYIREGYPEAREIYESALKEIKDEEIRRILEAAGRDLT